jgi:hypothetical protein
MREQGPESALPMLVSAAPSLPEAVDDSGEPSVDDVEPSVDGPVEPSVDGPVEPSVDEVDPSVDNTVELSVAERAASPASPGLELTSLPRPPSWDPALLFEPHPDTRAANTSVCPANRRMELIVLPFRSKPRGWTST